MAPAVARTSSLFVCRACRTAARKSRHRHTSTSSTTPPEIYDVVTVGGGPVGLALLAALKSSPVTSHLKCALVEAQDLFKLRKWSMPPTEYSNRASSLTPTNTSFLESIGAWQHVDQSRVQPYDEMQVWDAANRSSLQFDWSEEAVKYNALPRTVATMTENLNLTRGLLERISQLGADHCLLSSTSVAKIENGKDDPTGLNLSTWPVVSLNSMSSQMTSSAKTKTLAARLLIGADGFNSPVRTFAGITSHGWDYNRHGVVATLKLEPTEPTTFTDPNSMSLDDLLSDDLDVSETHSNRATAYQRFLPAMGGPIAVLPLPNNTASLVWSTTPEIASYLKSLSPESFVAIVNAALHLSQTDIKYLLSLSASETKAHQAEISWRLRHHESTTSSSSPPFAIPNVLSVQPNTVASFPLRLRHTTSMSAPHVALAGDAAHTIHPLAGQGLNLGLADVASLVKTISYAVEHGMDIGDTMTLDRYAGERFGKGLLMAAGTDGLNWMYQLGGDDKSSILGGEDALLGSIVGRIRGLSMGVVGSIPGLREFIMRRAE